MIPPEIWKHILSYLPVEDLKKCRLVSPTWKTITDVLLRHKVKIIFSPYNFRQASALFDARFDSVVILNPCPKTVTNDRYRMKSLLLALPSNLKQIAIVDSEQNSWSKHESHFHATTHLSFRKTEDKWQHFDDEGHMTISSVDAPFLARVVSEKTQQLSVYHARLKNSGPLTPEQFEELYKVFNKSLRTTPKDFPLHGGYFSWSKHEHCIRKKMKLHVHIIPSQMAKYEKLLRARPPQPPPPKRRRRRRRRRKRFFY